MSEEQVKTIGGKTFISLNLILAVLGGGGGSYFILFGICNKKN